MPDSRSSYYTDDDGDDDLSVGDDLGDDDDDGDIDDCDDENDNTNDNGYGENTIMRPHISTGLHHAPAADDDDDWGDKNDNTDDQGYGESSDDQNLKDARAKPWRERQLLL